MSNIFKELTPKDEQVILEAYESRTMLETSKHLGISVKTIQNVAKKHGTTKFAGYKKYTENFENLSEAQKGYICGLWATDGNLASKREYVTLGLQEKDKDVIDFLSTALTTPPLYITKVLKKGEPVGIIHPKRDKNYLAAQDQYRVGGALHKFYRYLNNMGITPKKSLTLTVNLEDKSDEFKWYFLRGVIDGDGSIMIGPSLVRCAIKIYSASLQFLKDLNVIFGGRIYRPPSDTVYQLIFDGNRAKQLLEHLPIDTFTMKRKTEKLKEIPKVKSSTLSFKTLLEGSIYRNYPIVGHFQLVNDVIEAYHLYKTMGKVQNALNVPRATITKVLKYFNIPLYYFRSPPAPGSRRNQYF